MRSFNAVIKQCVITELFAVAERQESQLAEGSSLGNFRHSRIALLISSCTLGDRASLLAARGRFAACRHLPPAHGHASVMRGVLIACAALCVVSEALQAAHVVPLATIDAGASRPDIKDWNASVTVGWAPDGRHPVPPTLFGIFFEEARPPRAYLAPFFPQISSIYFLTIYQVSRRAKVAWLCAAAHNPPRIRPNTDRPCGRGRPVRGDGAGPQLRCAGYCHRISGRQCSRHHRVAPCRGLACAGGQPPPR